jgi:hypothetical protein
MYVCNNQNALSYAWIERLILGLKGNKSRLCFGERSFQSDLITIMAIISPNIIIMIIII